jgi:hypothetical protein
MMKTEVLIRVFDIIGGPICVSADDGQNLYNQIAPLIREEHKVVLSFDRVKYLIPAFFNTAVGKLYEEFTEEEINRKVAFQDLPTGWDEMHRHLMGRAKAYFENSEAFDRAWRDEMGEEDWQ